jgi:hypothetical protein
VRVCTTSTDKKDPQVIRDGSGGGDRHLGGSTNRLL